MNYNNFSGTEHMEGVSMLDEPYPSMRRDTFPNVDIGFIGYDIKTDKSNHILIGKEGMTVEIACIEFSSC